MTTEAIKHLNVYSALCAAQGEMKPLIKSAANEAFKKGNKVSKYAELADVVDAVREPFTRNGLAFFHAIDQDPDLGLCMVTTLAHGESDTSLECKVPLIVDRQNMQGFKSATTYAKRIGLESVSGIAPEDDDGNAAAQAAPANSVVNPAPKPATSAHMKRELENLDRDLLDVKTISALRKLWDTWREKMNKEEWPLPTAQDDETAFRTQAKWKVEKHKEFLEANLDLAKTPELEPNLLMAGE